MPAKNPRISSVIDLGLWKWLRAKAKHQGISVSLVVRDAPLGQVVGMIAQSEGLKKGLKVELLLGALRLAVELAGEPLRRLHAARFGEDPLGLQDLLPADSVRLFRKLNEPPRHGIDEEAVERVVFVERLDKRGLRLAELDAFSRKTGEPQLRHLMDLPLYLQDALNLAAAFPHGRASLPSARPRGHL